VPETKGKTLEDMEPIFGALPPLNVKDLEEQDGSINSPDSPRHLDEKFHGNVTYLETTDPRRGRRSDRSRSVTPTPITRVMSS
jgi:hypothetical protein